MIKVDKNRKIPFYELECDNCGDEFQDSEGDNLFACKRELQRSVEYSDWYSGVNNIHYCESCNNN